MKFRKRIHQCESWQEGATFLLGLICAFAMGSWGRAGAQEKVANQKHVDKQEEHSLLVRINLLEVPEALAKEIGGSIAENPTPLPQEQPEQLSQTWKLSKAEVSKLREYCTDLSKYEIKIIANPAILLQDGKSGKISSAVEVLADTEEKRTVGLECEITAKTEDVAQPLNDEPAISVHLKLNQSEPTVGDSMIDTVDTNSKNAAATARELHISNFSVEFKANLLPRDLVACQARSVRQQDGTLRTTLVILVIDKLDMIRSKIANKANLDASTLLNLAVCPVLGPTGQLGDSPPQLSDEEVIQAFAKHHGLQLVNPGIRIEKTIVDEFADPSRFVPLIGEAILNHRLYQCRIELGPKEEPTKFVMFVDHNYFELN